MKKFGIFVLALFAAIGLTFGQGVNGSSFRGTNGSCPIVVQYIGTSTNSITITASLITVVADGNTFTQAMDPGTNLAVIVGWLNSITNGGGSSVFNAALWEGLSTDFPSNNLVACTRYVIKPTWDTGAFKWNTSTCLHYDVVADSPSGFQGLPAGNYTLAGVWGNIGGTGNVTLDIYMNDTLAYEQVITSPVYTLPASLVWGGTNVQTNTLGVDATVSLSSMTGSFPQIKVGGGKRCLVRATRATTATTGVIGASKY